MYLVSRTETFAKLFFIVSFTGVLMYVALAFYSFHTAYTTVSQTGREKKYHTEQFNNTRSHSSDPEVRFEKDLKYILVWAKYQTKNETKEIESEMLIPKEGQATFIENKCPDINCYITTNQSILNRDYMNFDAIVFNVSLMSKFGYFRKFPSNRGKRQKFVFYGKQPADRHPVCNIRVENFFNWTWTYKFYSDIFSPFIEVKNLDGQIVAPSRRVQWTTHLKPTTMSDRKKKNTKTKAIAWVVDNCERSNANYIKRMMFLPRLTKALKKFNLSIDLYDCDNKCPKQGCLKAIERDYYFYFASEETSSEDYVTAEVLKGYHHDAVPVVVGGADYTKFLPENSYINYQLYTEEKLAALIDYNIRNPAVYQQYFNWKNYYTIEKVEDHRGYCELCKMLNNKRKYKMYSTYSHFRSWWYDGSLRQKCLPKGAQNSSELKTYLKEPGRF